MRRILQTILVAGVALTAGASFALAQSGTTGDLNAPAGEPSVSDSKDVMQNTPAAPPAGNETMQGTNNTMQGSSTTTQPPGKVVKKRTATKTTHTTKRRTHPATTTAMRNTSRHRAVPSGNRGPCFAAAWDFDQKLQTLTKGGPQLGQATEMRNQGMEACNAGRVQEGRNMIRQATTSLGS